VQLDAKALSDWAAAIANETRFVNVECPPRSPEWDKILKLNARKTSASSFETHQHNQHAPMPNIIVQLPPTSRSPRHLQPRHSPRRSPRRHDSSPPYYRESRTPTQRRRQDLLSSPILVNHASWAPFDGNGLKAFIAHCEDKFNVGPGTEFGEAYVKLVDHDIRPDVMHGKSAEWYEAKGIKSGTAERIVRVFNKWYAKLMQDNSLEA
jgi:hypothetical protein